MTARLVIAGPFALPVVAVAAVAAYTGIRAAGYEKYWRDRAAEPRPADAFTLVAFGDSATVGMGALDPSNGFVSRAAKLITAQTGRPVYVETSSLIVPLTGVRVSTEFLLRWTPLVFRVGQWNRSSSSK